MPRRPKIYLSLSFPKRAQTCSCCLVRSGAQKREREKRLPASSDKEREIAALKTTLKNQELYLAVFHCRHRSTDTALSSAMAPHPLRRSLWPRPLTYLAPPSNQLSRSPGPRPHPRFNPPLNSLLCSVQTRAHSRLVPPLKSLLRNTRPRPRFAAY